VSIPSSRQAPGLLSFFGVKNGGRNPEYGMEQLNATIDMLQWLLADPTAPTYINGSVNAGAAGTAVTVAGGAFSVPDGQCWIVTEFTIVTAVLGAGITLQVTPMYDYSAGVTIIAACGPTSPVETVGAALIAAMDRTKPLILPPRSRLLAFSNQLVAGPPALTFEARFIPVGI